MQSKKLYKTYVIATLLVTVALELLGVVPVAPVVGILFAIELCHIVAVNVAVFVLTAAAAATELAVTREAGNFSFNLGRICSSSLSGSLTRAVIRLWA